MPAPASVRPGPLVHVGDCVEWLRSLDECSVDAIVTDPPYGLGFMGRAWDALPPGRKWAEACLRVLKPGGHLVAFGGTRTVHRLAVALEDAGFEIRDQVGWVYYSGFPKSLDVAKAIATGGRPEDIRRAAMGDAYVPSGRGRVNYDHGAASARNGVLVRGTGEWSGWGTALKPAIEPAVLARRPLEGTVASNVLHWGTGALNIDGCRFAPGDNAWVGPGEAGLVRPPIVRLDNEVFGKGLGCGVQEEPSGRFPANLYYCPKAPRKERERGCDALPARTGAEAVDREEDSAGTRSPRAGAGRTASKVRNHHPTVKPVRLMRWLARLVTPPGGLVIDPFLGSGTTGIAALLEGFRFAGAERETEYAAIAEARIRHAMAHPEAWGDGAPRAKRARRATVVEVAPVPAQGLLFVGGR